jgi:hypothetical protein
MVPVKQDGAEVTTTFWAKLGASYADCAFVTAQSLARCRLLVLRHHSVNEINSREEWRRGWDSRSGLEENLNK